MRAAVIGGGMAGLFTAIALRESGDAFEAVDVYEQTAVPTTAGAGLNIAPNGARLCHWLGIDLDGGDPKGPVGVPDGGRAAILDATRQIMPDLSVSLRPFDYNAPEKIAEGGGFHHMHRQDLLMCLHQRVAELGPESGVRCPITLHMGKRLSRLEQDEDSVTAAFEDGTSTTADVLIGADGIHSKVLELLWPGSRERRWTGSIILRGLIPKEEVAALRKRDGSPLDFSPTGHRYHDMIKRDDALCMSYWVRGGELLNVAITWYEPESREFHEDWGDWRAIDRAEVVETLARTWGDDPRGEEVIALAGAIGNPTKWGLFDRDALDRWQEGRVCLVGDAAHPMLPTFGQGASQSFEDGAALSKCFALHGNDFRSALLHYERVRHYRATRFQFGSKVAFKQLEPEDSAARRQILAATDERDMAIFDHEERAGSDDSWIYAYDARAIGDTLPPRRLGPWDFRTRTAGADARKDIYRNLWKPDVPLTGDKPVTRDELRFHSAFDDCWIVIRGKVYDFTEWKHHHPGGSFVARLFAGKDATAEFGDFHSRAAIRHMENFCVGPLVE
ncbi:cytochrome b5 domain-containing protein [Umezawaea sp. NPDC059074]|uniref:cytochrome b5 domain-containing protein n=1 Tax=Umezawaea sp. NPDC059074 TaxID=3346716 RepID=UPI00369EF5FF